MKSPRAASPVRRPAERRRVLCCATLSLLLPSLMLSCASKDADGEKKPFSEPPDPALAWHESILKQLGESWAERDLERMKRLLDQERVGANDDQAKRYATFGVLLESGLVREAGFESIGFALRAPERLDGGLMPPDLEFGQTAPIELRIQAAKGRQYRIVKAQDNGARTRFVLKTHFEDLRVDGSVTRSRLPYRFRAQRDLVLSGDKAFLTELPPLPETPRDVILRKVRIEGALVCASFESDGRALVIPRLDLEPVEFTCFLKGFRTSKVRSEPLAVLKVATQDPGRFAAHLLTAAFFLERDFDAATRRRATAYLIEALRASTAAKRAVLAALVRVVGEDRAPEMRDRDAWLRWWDLRSEAAKKR